MKRAVDSLQSSNLLRIALATAVILLLPLVAMRFTDEVRWGPVDFVVAGVLLFGAGLTYDFLVRKAGNAAYRAAVGIAVVTALLLVWVNLAVGIIGNADDPANLMYAGVLAILLVGAVLARFRPDGMSRALFATALAQMTVAVIAQIAALDSMLMLNGFFAALWIGSALLFRRAERR